MRLLVLSSAFVCFACEVPIESFCAAQRQAWCDHGQRCGLVSRAIDCSKRGGETDCLGYYRSGLGAGVLTYDAAEAARCVEAIRASGCTTIFLQPQSCLDMVAGSAKEGAQCGGCAKGLLCQAGTSCGTCVPTAPRPQIVGLGQACVQGLRGPFCGEGLACSGEVCVALPPLGAACTAGLCQAGLRCSPVDNKCGRAPDLGDECTFETGCLGGLRCIDGRCALIAENGGTCRTALECQSDLCLDGVCQPHRARGEACDEVLFCGDQLECIAGVCVGLPLAGEACPRYRCASPATCVSGTCRDPVVECR